MKMKLFRSEESMDIEKLRAELAELGPLTAKLKAEKQAETLARRQETRAKLDALTQERDTTVEALRADLTGKEQAYHEAKKTLDAATDAFRTAKFELANAGHSFDIKMNHHRETLTETADPAIVEAQKWFNDKLSELRKPGVIARIARPSKKNIINWTKKTEEETNRSAVLSALEYCKTAIQELETMKLNPALDSGAIERLKAEIPRTDIFQTVEGEANLPRTIDGRMAAREECNLKESRLRRLLAA